VILASVLGAALTLTSPAFATGGKIPVRYTCDGKGVSPPLRWTAPPRGTRSLTLLVVDPDAPNGNFIHWRASGISPSARGLREGQHLRKEGSNSAGTRGWVGPCPPRGPAHEYLFVLKALNARGQAIVEGDLIGHYARR
jgi:Raf kinase inhibitor-like YbhB/YbcL family protein